MKDKSWDDSHKVTSINQIYIFNSLLHKVVTKINSIFFKSYLPNYRRSSKYHSTT